MVSSCRINFQHNKQWQSSNILVATTIASNQWKSLSLVGHGLYCNILMDRLMLMLIPTDCCCSQATKLVVKGEEEGRARLMLD